MLEKHFENILSRYPELIEEGITFLDRQISVGRKFADLLFKDRFGQELIVELKRCAIKREHIAQLLDYEGYFLSGDNPTVRVMLIGNRVPPNLRKSLDHHGFEWKEIQVEELVEHLKDKDDRELLEQFEEVDKRLTQNREFDNTLRAGRKVEGGVELSQLNKSSNFKEVEKSVYIRSKQVPSYYIEENVILIRPSKLYYQGISNEERVQPVALALEVVHIPAQARFP